MESSQLFLVLWTVLVFWALGQIWFAQIVIYPLFAQVGESEYVRYHRFYLRRIPLPVIIPGFLCFILPIPLVLYGPAFPVWMNAANVIAGILGLLVTVLLEIPRHRRLERAGKDGSVITELVLYNWPRTLSISVQSIITFLMLGDAFRNP